MNTHQSGKQSKEYLDNLRHSCAHLLAAAVLELYPKTKRTIGPSIENGFYYDFDFGDVKISEEDFPMIEAKMKELVKSWKGFERKDVTTDEAKEYYKDNEYKIELIEEFSSEGKDLTFYNSGSYSDLCRGGHVNHPESEIKHFKLLSVAGAYWRGSEKNKMLTRIYGTCFSTKAELDEYLEKLEKAKESDHRVIGKKLGLFAFSDLVGKGLPMLTPKGSVIRRVLERFIVDEEIKRGYSHVYTPALAKTDLYKTSGHYPYYKDTMYPVMKIDEEELILRPMTCPHHFMLYKSSPRSYKDLPIMFAETSPQFRYEKSGELSGLMRVRTFMLSDAHIFTKKDEASEVIKGVLDLIDYVNSKLSLKRGEDYRFRLSLGDRSDSTKYYKDDQAWEHAEGVLRDVLKEGDFPYFEAEKEAAFYGPKIDVQVKKVNGSEETAFTVQYDFVMPKRFELTYTDDNGKEVEPVVIHRASLGAYERTMAFLIEKTGGAFPTWLSPVQVKVLPISEKHLDYANKVFNELKESGIRVELDERAETLGNKIRNATAEKVPYMLIMGDKEIENNEVSVRNREGQSKSYKLADFIKNIKVEIEDKK